MINIRCTAGLTAILVLVAAQGAMAGLATDINTFVDGNSYVWSGSQEYKNTPVFPQLHVDVEYAVYGRAGFDLSFPTNTLPAATGTQYVYAYQIFNDLNPHAGGAVWAGSEDYVQVFTTGLNDGDEEAANPGYVAGTGVAPISSIPTTASAKWTFLDMAGKTRVHYGDVSAVLYYTSPHPPEWDNATVQGYNASTILDSLPSPGQIPEPTTLLLLTLGAVAACRRKR